MEDNELFGERHEQEENGLYGKRHAELCDLHNVTPCFFVALVYQNTEATMLRTLVTKSENKDEALGKAIEYFAEETKGYGLVMKIVTSPNEG